MKNSHAQRQIMPKISATIKRFSPADPYTNELATER